MPRLETSLDRTATVVVPSPTKFLTKEAPELFDWIKDTLPRLNLEAVAQIHLAHPGEFHVHFWTARDEFKLYVVLPRPGEKRGYMGGSCWRRAPRVGEQHRRGRDLFDGPYRRATWEAFFREMMVWSFEELPIKVAPLLPARKTKAKAR